jgi:hypothetical protein
MMHKGPLPVCFTVTHVPDKSVEVYKTWLTDSHIPYLTVKISIPEETTSI